MDEIATAGKPICDDADDADDALEVLDLRGLKCPMPVLRTRKALRRLTIGQSLRVLTTDPLAGIDIPHLVRQDGHLLTEASQDADGVGIFVLVKQAPDRRGATAGSALRIARRGGRLQHSSDF